MSNAFVVALGLGTTFFGLICIVVLIKIMGFVIGKLEKTDVKASAAPAPAPVAAAPAPKAASSADPNLIAVISCALAEELGTDVSNVIVTSVTKA